ncbi:MAG: NmrA family NAD(P)-binding protein, partial [Methylocella sp.]
MYAITGITGQVGGAVARTLLAARLPVRAVVRAASKGVT